MTVRELIAKLQQQDPDLPVFAEDAEWGPLEIDEVRFDSAAIVKAHYEHIEKEETFDVMVNGVMETRTEVLKAFPVTRYTDIPGVVLS